MTYLRRELMKRFLVICTASVIAVGCLAPRPAAASDGFFTALVGGLAVGTMLGVAASQSRVYYAEPVYAEPIYVPACYWTRGRPAWDPARGIWYKPRVQVCD